MKWIRWSGLIPFILITAAVYIITTYYLDSYLRRTLIKQGTKVNGALVEVDSLRLSFLRSRFEIRGLRATDPKDLMRNRMDVGSLVADIRFFPMLKKKFVIDDATVSEVRWATPRKTAGAIPAAWVKEWEAERKDEGPSIVAQTLNEFKERVGQELPDLDPKSLGERFDPRNLVKLDELTSYQQARALPSEAKTLASDLEARSKKLLSDQKNELGRLRRQIESLNPQKMKSPAEALSAIQTVKNLKSDVENQKENIQAFASSSKAEITNQIEKVKSLKDLVREDIARLKAKIGFGGIDISKISESIFGLSVVEKYRTYLSYYEKGRSTLAKFQKKEEKPKRERAKGRVIHFPVTDRTPTFLLSHMLLSADTSENVTVPEEARGRFALEATKITSHPKLTGAPMTARLTAQTPKSYFTEAEAHFSYAHATADPVTEFGFSLAGYKLRDTTLGPRSVFPLKLAQGRTDWRAQARIQSEKIQASLKGDFAQLSYDFGSQEKVHPLIEILRDIIRTIRSFDVGISLSGELFHPRVSISSTFDNALKSGIEKTLLAQVRKAQEKLERYISENTTKYINEAQAIITAQRDRANKLVTERLGEVEKLRKLADQKIRELEKKKLGAVKDQTDKLKKKLPGGIKF